MSESWLDTGSGIWKWSAICASSAAIGLIFIGNVLLKQDGSLDVHFHDVSVCKQAALQEAREGDIGDQPGAMSGAEADVVMQYCHPYGMEGPVDP